VRTDDELLDVTLGSAGVLEGASPGTLVLLHPTTLPQTTIRIAEAAQSRDVHVIDATMLGVPDVVRAGRLRFLAGGAPELVERARPHLLRMGEQVIHVGTLGTGNAAKLIHNLLSGAQTLLVHEALLVGEAAGIPYPQTLDLMRDLATERRPFDQWQRTFDPSGADPTPRVGFNTLPKDVPLAGELAELYGLETPIISALATAALRLTR
jgi:3-hydroxyisobutyrate dehydrogenase-like beta-hydroxyacid dehydrogenase